MQPDKRTKPKLSPAATSERLDSAAPARPPQGVTFRAVALGALLIPVNAFWIVRLERVMFGPYPSTISLFANVVFILFLFVGLNAILKRTLPRSAFSQGELLTLYTMLAISTGLAGLDGVGILSQMIPHGAWFGTVHHWEPFLSAFPRWLIVTDKEAVRGHYIGNTTFYHLAILKVWIVPMLAWTGFITLLLFVANCINVLVRRQWADSERLTFPIIWLPIEMTEEGVGTSLFRNKLLWAGFAIAALLSLWNGLAFLYPSLPALPLGITDMKSFFTAKPWNSIDWFPITFYPLAIGLGFLLPLDLLFSCWFFFLYWKMQGVVSNAMSWDTTPDFPFIKEQGFGSIVGLFLFYLWSGRRAYGAIWRNALASFKSGAEPQRTSEALSDRTALLGLALGTAALITFCLSAGVAWWIAVAFFAIYLPTIAVITRIRAELGAPVHDFHFMGPDAMLPRLVGSSTFKPADMAFLTFGYALTRAHRSDTMPVGLEGLQMAKLRQMDARRMFGAIMLATVLGTLGAFWAFEHQAYALGAASKFNQGSGHAMEAFNRTNSWFSGSLDPKPNGQASIAMLVGLVTTLSLFALRLRFFGFPFHPIGYAISSSWAINLVWMPLFIAWGLKGLTLRYGGLPTYRRFVPFFLGLILGDCVMGSIWALAGLLLNARTYNFFGA
ncbi:MAG: hypothetical protein JWL77_1624 [Chthonomonadaceae bacterium]|nr:hypothetical protein [Chthonomonadaceae bacterium]